MSLKLYPKLLLIILALAIVPLVGLTIYTTTIGRHVISDEIRQGLIRRGVEIAERVSMRLEQAVSDTQLLRNLPQKPQAYLDFMRARMGEVWTRVGTAQDYVELQNSVPLYREIAFIGPDGRERMRIESVLDEEGLSQKRYHVDTRVVPPSQLRDVSDPAQTLFPGEEYFARAKALPKGEVFVDRVVGWYVTAQEQLLEAKTPEEAIGGKRYDGIIRFAAPVYERGRFAGVVTLALDHVHLQELTIHIDPLASEPLVIAPYASGNYVFLFDDEGWIVTHQKLWDIRGLNPDGRPVAPFTNVEGTNRGPVNLVRGPKNEAHERLRALLQDVHAGRAGVSDVVNIGLNSKSPVMRAQAWAPIPFGHGVYRERGVFGGVMVGAQLEAVGHASAMLMRGFWIFLGAAIVVIALCAALVARSITRPMRQLTGAARAIADGDLDRRVPEDRRDEMGALGRAFNRMAHALQEKMAQLEESHGRRLSLKQRLAEQEKRQRLHLQSRLDRLERELNETPIEGFISASAAMHEVLASVRRFAQTSATVLILGERGTGKEQIASAIHTLSPRRQETYLRVNCSAIPETLVESELFGHVRGAFTGADRDRPGLFEAAGGGTLLLDEIGEVNASVQSKLLRVLQEKTVRRVGDRDERNVDTRLIVATNRDLSGLVRSGQFRADLFDRINVAAITIPPLRERREDILPLARHFLQQASARYNKNILGFSETAVERMETYGWPGNVRELENAIERAVIMLSGDLVEDELLILSGQTEEADGFFTVPDMTIEEMKVRYAQAVRARYPGKPLGAIKEILGVDWNTLRKYLKQECPLR